MSERKYTVAEIDQMRYAIEFRWLYNRKISEVDFNTSANGVTMSRTYKEEEKTKCVEELLRTYMLAGIEPKDLE